MSSRVKWLIAAAAACVTLTPSAFAAGDGAAETAHAESAGLQEIVVTARKTEERIEDVPLAIRAFDPAELAKSGSGGLKDISEMTPGFVFQEYSSSFDASPTIRGLTQFDVTSPVANVSTVVNGVYVPRNYSVDLGIADVSRLEIVKGPQSALYGGNAFAGVIAYNLAPAPTATQAEMTINGGTNGRFDTKFAIGGSAFEDVLALRLNYASSKYAGTWQNNFPNDASGHNQNLGGHDNETYGAALRFSPTKAVEFDVNYFHLDRHEDLKPAYNVTSSDAQNKYNCGTFICGTLSWDPGAYQSATSPRLPGIVQPFQAGFTSGTDFFDLHAKVDITDELRASYVFGNVKSFATEITSSGDNPVTPPIGLYLPGLLTGQFIFGPYFGAQKEGGLNQFQSHEIRLDWDHGPVKALIGFYSSHDTDHYQFNITSILAGSRVPGDPTQPFDFAGFQFPLLGQILTDDTTAEFGRLGYDFADNKANVAVELRHSAEDLKSAAPTGGPTRKVSFDETTPRFTAAYKLTPDNLLYASAAQGVKQGGFNPTVDGTVAVLPAEQTFAPEKNWTYEIGTKNTLFGGRAIINADIFEVKWSNLQIQEQPSNTPAALAANTAVITTNLGAATSKGFESDGRFAATAHIDLNYALSVIDPTFDSGTRSQRFHSVCDGTVCPANDDISGNTLPRTSKVQAAAGVTWKDTLTDSLTYSLHGGVTYQSEQNVEEMNLAKIPSRTLVNASAGLHADHWDLTLWGKNIFDKRYVADSFFVLVGTAVGYGASLGELATAGLSFSAHY